MMGCMVEACCVGERVGEEVGSWCGGVISGSFYALFKVKYGGIDWGYYVR